AGDAVEGRDLLGLRQRRELVVGEALRPLDESADLEPPARRVEDRHRSRDRVDPPAADREQIAHELAARRGQRRQESRDLPGPEQRRRAAGDEEQETRASVAMFRARQRIGHRSTSCLDMYYAKEKGGRSDRPSYLRVPSVSAAQAFGSRYLTVSRRRASGAPLKGVISRQQRSGARRQAPLRSPARDSAS